MPVIAGPAQAEDESLFPKTDEVNTEKPSLNSAIAQFDAILETSADGDMQNLEANKEYNQQRILQLQQQLAEKKEYLETIPDIVSRQFDALMKQHADADQEAKNKMADDLHARWKAKEARVKQEIAELEQQLAVATNRTSEAAIKWRMLEISNSLAKSEKALRQKTSGQETDPEAENAAFKNLQDLSCRRILSKIRGLCSIQLKPLDTQLSIKYLDN